MHIIIASILDVSNASQNTNTPTHERVCAIPPPCYMEWFEKYFLMFLSISITVHFLSNVWMWFKVKIQQKISGIDSLMQWSQLWNTRKAQSIIPSTFRCFKMLLYTILQYLMMMLWIILIMSKTLLNSENYFKKNLRLKSNNDLSLNTWIFGFPNLLLVSVFIILITSWSW